jgi:hypothetical protein
MRSSLWSNPMRVFMHEHHAPQNKLTQKHVMFRWWPNIHFNQLKIACHERWASKREPQNLPFIETCQVLVSNPMRISMLMQPKPPKHIPPKHVTFRELCFGPIHPSSMFPHVIPVHAPWPIHDTLHIFNFSMFRLTFDGLLYEDHQWK